ncbi:MAG: hypothetical protein AB8G96_01425 [Phycisphaerales bacterium]
MPRAASRTIRFVVGVCLAVAVLMPVRFATGHPPSGIAVDGDGRVVFVEGGSWRLVGLRPESGRIRPIAGDASPPATEGSSPRPWMPHQVVRGPGGRLFTADAGTGQVLEVDGDRVRPWTPDAGAPTGRPGAGGMPFTIDERGAVWWARGLPGRRMEIVRQAPGGEAVVVAGGATGFVDGPAGVARFTDLDGGSMAWGPSGSLYVVDDGRAVRRVASDGTVKTIAGDRPGAGEPSADGFGRLGGIAVDARGTVFVVDRTHRCIRTIDAAGAFGVVERAGDAGDAAGAAGAEDAGEAGDRADGPSDRDRNAGPVAVAVETQPVRLDAPTGVAVDPSGTVWVLDQPTGGGGRTIVVRIGRDGSVSRFDPQSAPTKRSPG